MSVLPQIVNPPAGFIVSANNDPDHQHVRQQHAQPASPRRGGVGESGIDFFVVPGISDPTARRDYLVLKSLGDALTLAASDNFQAA